MKAQSTELQKDSQIKQSLSASEMEASNAQKLLSRKPLARGLRPTRSIYKAKMLRPKSCLPLAILKNKPE